MSDAPYQSAVEYAVTPNGQLSITLTRPWEDKFFIDTLPHKVSQIVRANFFQSATEDEARKLEHARAMGNPTFSAVLDDLWSRRAIAILEDQRKLTALKRLYDEFPSPRASEHLSDYLNAEPQR